MRQETCSCLTSIKSICLSVLQFSNDKNEAEQRVNDEHCLSSLQYQNWLCAKTFLEKGIYKGKMWLLSSLSSPSLIHATSVSFSPCLRQSTCSILQPGKYIHFFWTSVPILSSVKTAILDFFKRCLKLSINKHSSKIWTFKAKDCKAKWILGNLWFSATRPNPGNPAFGWVVFHGTLDRLDPALAQS